ncbi:MAG: hypothetical protein JSR45_11525 [Proteobacteria bacterium]|nr:hypothetical protein [Pseudomonadota bacterium]
MKTASALTVFAVSGLLASAVFAQATPPAPPAAPPSAPTPPATMAQQTPPGTPGAAPTATPPAANPTTTTTAPASPAPASPSEPTYGKGWSKERCQAAMARHEKIKPDNCPAPKA